MNIRLLILWFFFCFATLQVHSQIQVSAEHRYYKALSYQAKKNYPEARKLLERLLVDYPNYTDAYSTLSKWYFTEHQFLKAKEVLQKGYQTNKAFAYPFAKALIYSGEPELALSIINTYSNTGRKEWQQLKAQATFVAKALQFPIKDSIYNLGRPNTSDPELYPWLTTDSTQLNFTRRISGIDEDFFMTTVDSCGGWFTGSNLGRPPNSLDQESAQMISADGHYLFYTKCENRSVNGWAQGGCDLYMSYRVANDSPWSSPEIFGATINTPNYEGMGCLSADNKVLYFVSDRAGGFGGKDIWEARFENGLWQEPKNLGSNINTPNDETAPYLHVDNQTLYFSSTGHPGMGGSDFFISRKLNDTSWEKALNLGYPINTAADENGLCITPSGKHLYFSSDRDSLAGNFDIYHMDLPLAIQPLPVAFISGVVQDSLQKGSLNYARMTIVEAGNDKEIYNFLSNKGDGSYTVTLPIGKTYYLSVGRFGFTDKTDTLNLIETIVNDRINHPISMLPYDYIAPVQDSLIYTIYYSKNVTLLTDSLKNVLYQVMAPWMEAIGSTAFYINSYTDNTGSPLINEQISYTRAKHVAEQIISFGAYDMNVHPEGWGEGNPAYSNDTEEGRNANRRVEIIIRR
jgi:outer membrane protein OmpA-like peptidoglycan-associated protein